MSFLGIYLVIAGILVIVYITLSIVLFVKIDGFNQAFNKQVNYQQSMFSDELQLIDTNLIADIQIVIGSQNCPDEYSDNLFQYTYYGTQQGCQCYSSYQLGIIKESCCKQGESDTGYYKTEYYEEYNSTTEQYETKTKQVYVPPDCTCYGEEIKSIEQKILKKFQMYNQNSNQYENIKGCLKYLEGYTFKTKSPLLDEENNLYCKDQNDKPCGNENNGICYPKNIGCPIVNIYFSDSFPSSQYDGEDDVMEQVISSNFQTKAYIQRMGENDENPLTQFYVTEGQGVCSGIHNNFSPNRESYILEIQQRNMCQDVDSGFRTANIEIQEIDFFEINDSNYYDRLQDLPEWVDFDNSYEYQLYQSDIQGMIIYCRQFYDLYDGFQQIIIDIKSRVSNISSALIGFGILYLILNPTQLFFGIYVLDKQVCIGMSFNIFFTLIKIAIFQPVFWTYHANYYKELQNLDQYKIIVNSDYDCPGKDELFNIFKSLDDDIQNKLNFLKIFFINLNVFSPEGLFCGGLIIAVLITLIYVTLDQISQIGCDKCLKKMCYIFTCCFCGYGIYQNILRKKEQKREKEKQKKIKDTKVLQEQLDKKQKNEIKIDMNRRNSYQHIMKGENQLKRGGSLRNISITQDKTEVPTKKQENKDLKKIKINQKQQDSTIQLIKNTILEPKKSKKNTIIINDQLEQNCTIPIKDQNEINQNSFEKINTGDKPQQQIKHGIETNSNTCHNVSPKENKSARYKIQQSSFSEQEEEKEEKKENYQNKNIQKNNYVGQNEIYINNDFQKNKVEKKNSVDKNQGDNISMESFTSSEISSSSWESDSASSNSYTNRNSQENKYNQKKDKPNEDLKNQRQKYQLQELKKQNLNIKSGENKKNYHNYINSDSESYDSELEESSQENSRYRSQYSNYDNEQLQKSENSYQNKSLEIQKPQNPFIVQNMGDQNTQEKDQKKEKAVNFQQKRINPYYSKIKNKKKKLFNYNLKEQVLDNREYNRNNNFGILEPNIIAKNQIMKSYLNYNYPEEE
ncbi:hypothetical protein PPERSA_09120 [Pseudocohnilembus persalinus]|uniref:Transmembrane protein n=1 Tax=Pseudocohnilembus persalinus TaxID=266149 RepID=A0A0V0QWW1_PSEPJ|nr:hypothetical protein PPERSA_09120 [Pseudocohnilembus persalinus]|eukprot:KRX06718.1 hypothetical protein PPERSA_09120 [Pseudocohnilembus persalinus]